MGKSCAVVSCGNWTGRGKKRGPNLHFFKFPQNLDLQAVWLRRCGRSGTTPVHRLTVCSEHFLPEDFDQSLLLKARLMNYNKAGLREGVVPSQRLSPQKRYALLLQKCKFNAIYIWPLDE